MLPRTPSRRPVMLAGPIVMTVGAAITIAGAFASWIRSGTRERSSFELLALVERLGFSPDGGQRRAIDMWPLMPLLVTVGVVAAWWGLRRWGAVVGLVAAAYAGGIGGAVAFFAPDPRGVELSSAPLITAVGALVLAIGCLVTFVPRPESGRPAELTETAEDIAAPDGVPIADETRPHSST